MLPANVRPQLAAARRPAATPAAGVTTAAGLKAITRLYWPAAWKAAAALALLLVVRLSEIWEPLGRLHPTLLGSAVTSVILVIRTPGSSWQRAFGDKQLLTTVLYGVTIMMSVPLALWRGGTISTLMSLPYFIMMLVVVLLCRPLREDLDKLLGTVVLGAGFYGVYNVVFGKIVNDTVGGDRLGTTGMYDANDLAAMLAVMMQLAMGLALRTKGKWRLAAVVSLCAMAIVFLKTGSRGGMVAFAVATPILMVSLNVRRLIPMFAALVVGLPLAWQLGPETFRVRFISIFNLDQDYTTQSESGRLKLWGRGFRYFMESPVIGVGANNYQVREGKEFESRHEGGHWLSAHNTYLQVLVELGIFGALALYVLLYNAVRDGLPLWRRPPPREPGRLHRPEVFSALVSFLVSSCFLSHGYMYLQFFVVAICLFGRRIQEAERKSGISGARQPARASEPSRVRLTGNRALGAGATPRTA